MIEMYFDRATARTDRLNELRLEFGNAMDFWDACVSLATTKQALLRLMFGSDDRPIDGLYRIHAVFSIPGMDRFYDLSLPLREGTLSFPSLTPEIPAAHWYEREIRDMFGIVPEGHPDPSRLVFHESFPEDSHPLRKDWQPRDEDLRKWGGGTAILVPHPFMEVEGSGIYEIPVGPVHAGIIEPGHFRFSAIGETILFLEPRLFYTHKGTEKHFESLSLSEGVRLAERVSGTSSFSHGAAYCMAVERLAGLEIPEKARAVRTLLLELERIYNHIGDIGNICAGTALQVGYARGAMIKESLMQLNARLTGSRYLRGLNIVGGVTRDVFSEADDILRTLGEVTADYKSLMDLLLGTVSHVDRLENTGVLSKEIARKLGVTGVAARASGINDDLRKAHPHFLYDRLQFEPHTMARGDVFARMMVRAAEAECSISMIHELLESTYRGELAAEPVPFPAHEAALGFTETPRGSVFYWVRSDTSGKAYRVKLRSPSFCNWPAVPFAVHGNIVPDFPLCNKSFNLSYSGCDT